MPPIPQMVLVSGVVYTVQAKQNLTDSQSWSGATVSAVNASQSPTPPDGYVRRKFSIPAEGASSSYRMHVTVTP